MSDTGLSLISGLVGALAGGFLSYRGALAAVAEAARVSREHEQERYALQDGKRKEMAAGALASEILQNLDVSERAVVDYAKVPFSTDAWLLFRADLVEIRQDAWIPMMKAYSEISRYNALVNYDLHKIAPGIGTVDAAINIQKEVTVKALKNALMAIG